MRSHEAVHDGETEPGSAGRGSGAAVKGFKDVRQIRFRDPAGLRRAPRELVAIRDARANYNFRSGRAMGGCVQQEIAERLLQQCLINLHDRQIPIEFRSRRDCG